MNFFEEHRKKTQEDRLTMSYEKMYFKNKPYWNKLFNAFFNISNHSEFNKILDPSGQPYISDIEIAKYKEKIEMYPYAIKDISPNIYYSYWKGGVGIDELWDDLTIELDDFILGWRVDKFIRKNIGNKYRNLVNEDVKNALYKCIDNDLSIDTIKNTVIDKIARFTTSSELNIALRNLLNQSFNWNLSAKTKEYDNKNMMYFVKGSKVWVMVQKYSEVREFAPVSWCIQNSLFLYQDSLKNVDVQFLILDFNKFYVDATSIIGVSIDKDGDIMKVHNFFNQPMKDSQIEEIDDLFEFAALAKNKGYKLII